MIAAAQVLFENTWGAQCLEWLLSKLPDRIPYAIARTEWRGFTTTILQIRVATRPVALTVQVDDDPEYVPAEIAEVADAVHGRLDHHTEAALRRCQARLDIMSATPVEPTITDEAITVVAETDLDPSAPEPAAVLLALAELTGGYVLDCVNGRLRALGSATWVPLETA